MTVRVTIVACCIVVVFFAFTTLVIQLPNLVARPALIFMDGEFCKAGLEAKEVPHPASSTAILRMKSLSRRINCGALFDIVIALACFAYIVTNYVLETSPPHILPALKGAFARNSHEAYFQC